LRAHAIRSRYRAKTEDLCGDSGVDLPGRDAAHATSAARYLEQCLPRAEYWDVPVEGQTEAPTVARVIEFLAKA
jgi:hypothetical protein